MFTIDDIIKLILALSVAFSIVAVAYQVARLLSETANIVKDLRKPLNDVSQITELAVEDYKRIRQVIDFVVNIKETFGSFSGLMRIFSDSKTEKDS